MINGVQQTVLPNVSENVVAPATAYSGSAARSYGLTVRGLLLCLLAAFLILGPSRSQSDIVATVAGYSLTMIIATFGTLVLIQALILPQALISSLRAEWALPHDSSGSDSSAPIAGTSSRIVLRTVPLRTIPLITVRLTVPPSQGKLNCAQHVLTGGAEDGERLIDDLAFPHRGEWVFARTSYRVEDYFGLFCIRREAPLAVGPAAVRVRPRLDSFSALPILSSAVRSGDDVSHHVEHQGDPLDLKQYHPSDGVRRIVWKVFAKTGELITRHPERSMTPEGRVVCFVAAHESDDAPCAAALEYLKRLEELSLDLLVSCEGAGGGLAFSSTEAEAQFIDAAFKTSNAAALSADFQAFLGGVKSALGAAQLECAVIFANVETIADSLRYRALSGLGSVCEREGIRPVFALCGATTFRRQVGAREREKAAKIWSLFMQPKNAPTKTYSETYATQFLNDCASHQWDVHALS